MMIQKEPNSGLKIPSGYLMSYLAHLKSAEMCNQGNETANARNLIPIVDDRDQALRQSVLPLFHELNPSIVRPEIEAPQFKFKPVMFQML
ncbi:transcription factor MYB34 [Gossypium australe]|uniref:Transcription factor MYB34 n=1 Tax=Gossypium australe TaxID=47621 RepID=A0A5B6VB47_9ROSI|nr:transcription factor MYB34 [Gossypium australe]